jgi:hypothetical protein
MNLPAAATRSSSGKSAVLLVVAIVLLVVGAWLIYSRWPEPSDEPANEAATSTERPATPSTGPAAGGAAAVPGTSAVGLSVGLPTGQYPTSVAGLTLKASRPNAVPSFTARPVTKVEGMSDPVLFVSRSGAIRVLAGKIDPPPSLDAALFERFASRVLPENAPADLLGLLTTDIVPLADGTSAMAAFGIAAIEEQNTLVQLRSFTKDGVVWVVGVTAPPRMSEEVDILLGSLGITDPASYRTAAPATAPTTAPTTAPR